MVECTLLPGIFGMFLQVVLFGVSCSVLFVKKKREERLEGENARSWPIFLLDSSKQLVGAGALHAMNLAAATLFVYSCPGDACEWYWVNIMLDTTFGVFLTYLVLWKLLIPAFERCSGHTGAFVSGEYKDEMGILIPRRYWAQLGCWLICLSLTKLTLVLLMYLLQNPLLSAADGFLTLFPTGEKVRLVIVMVVTPCFMNAVQFWIQDQFLKRGALRMAGSLPRDVARPLQPNALEDGRGSDLSGSWHTVPELQVSHLQKPRRVPEEPRSVESTASTATS